MNESEVKRRIVKSMHESGGYGRRIEDQYAVGTYDMILIPRGLPTFYAEVKIIYDNVFKPTARQLVELMRIQDAAGGMGFVIPVVIGWKAGNFYFHRPAKSIDRRDCFSVTTSDMEFHKQLVLYYYSQKGQPNEP